MIGNHNNFRKKAYKCNLRRISFLKIFLGAANSAVPGRILPNFEFILDLIVVLVTCKNEEDQIKKKALV